MTYICNCLDVHGRIVQRIVSGTMSKFDREQETKFHLTGDAI